MQVEPCEIPFAGLPKSFVGNGFKPFPTGGTPQQACPVLDTGKDEENAADGGFSAAC